MKLISLKIKGFKNLDFWDNPIDFTKSEGISIFVGNNGSGKSNVLEAISAIFNGLYIKKDFDPKFEFELIYKISKPGETLPMTLPSSLNTEYEVKVMHEDNFLSFYINKRNQSLTPSQIDFYLPSQIIALYSGEETRLYEDFYKNTDKNFYKKVNMIFIDKNFWEIALLIMFISVINFDESDNLYKGLSKILGNGVNIDKIELIRSKSTGKMLLLNNQSNEFLDIIKKINNKSIVEISSIKYDIPLLSNPIDFYKGISHYFLGNENVKYIDSINLTFNNGINSKHLSEGQKKQILIYFATNFLAGKDSIILLDEPDSYIHVGNKEILEKFFNNFIYSNEEDKSKYIENNREGEVIMTTHSPTLMNKFDKKHLFYLENGKLDDKSKAEILEQIAGDNMSYTDQQIILNTTKDIIIVEGKTDEIYIQTALEKLKEDNPQYKSLEFEFIPAGGADGIQLFMNKFKPKEGQKIMIFFDRDDSGWKGLEKILGKTIDKGNKDSFTCEVKDNYYISCYPKKNGFSEPEFVIEDYFELKLFTDFLLKDIKCFKNIPQKDKRKTDFANECKNYDKSEFEGFKPLFDLINSF